MATFIKPSYSELSPVPLFTDLNFDEALAYIESAGRTCYKSEDQITSDSGSRFVGAMFKSGHHSVIEHSNFVIRSMFENGFPAKLVEHLKAQINSKYLNIVLENGYVFIGGNVRAWVDEFNFPKDRDIRELPEYILSQGLFMATNNEDASQSIPYYVSVHDNELVPDALVKFGCRIVHDRAFTHELVRHRVLSYSQESQRYCNYGKEKFGKQVTFIESKEIWDTEDEGTIRRFTQSCENAESDYFDLLARNILPQVARGVLGNACKTEIFTSGDLGGWLHMFGLRTAGGAHPDMRFIMPQIQTDFNAMLVKLRYETSDKA